MRTGTKLNRGRVPKFNASMDVAKAGTNETRGGALRTSTEALAEEVPPLLTISVSSHPTYTAGP